jgi:hypothetical protein
MTHVPATVKDRATWLLAKELDDLGENLTSWECDFLESLLQDLLLGRHPSEARRRKLDEVRGDRLP